LNGQPQSNESPCVYRGIEENKWISPKDGDNALDSELAATEKAKPMMQAIATARQT
jgi:hypothetical protein